MSRLRPIPSHPRIQLALLAALVALAALVLAQPAPAAAAKGHKKAIWGPVQVDGVSQFPIYDDLGAGIYQYAVGWHMVAPSRPADPRDPDDPAYQWPADLDLAISEAARYGMRVSLLLLYAPPWANGGQGHAGRPIDPQDFADFAVAAARRYPSVRLWQVWGEPSISSHFKPLSKKGGPRHYAQMLDATYAELKRINSRNLVIGGNTITAGEVKPLDWIRNMRLPNGRPPRMDMYGHNPFSPRKPDLRRDPVKRGTADTSDLDTLIGWLDRYLHKGKRNRKLKLFIGEWTIPSDHSARLFGFWAARKTVADYLKRALRIARKDKRIYTLGWFSLYDEQPTPSGDQVNWGLLTADGARKPAYYAFKRG